MANKIKPKRSYTTNAVPTAADLEVNELAINWADGIAYTKDASGQIVSLTMGGGGGSSVDSRWDLFLPPAPTGLAGTAGDAEVSLSWTAPTGVLAQTPVTDYIVQYSSDGGSNWATFADGTSTGTTATVTGLTNDTGYTFRVAAVNGVGTGSFSDSVAKTPTAMPTDPDFANVSLLLHMDGANNSTTFTDSSSNARTISRSGTTAPVVSTAQSKFGGASGLFVNGQLDIPGAAAFQGTEDFTLEFWLYWSSIATSDASFTALDIGTGHMEFGIFNAAQSIILSTPGGVQVANFGSKNQLPANQWNYVAMSRSGNTFRCFINGTITTSGAITSSANLGTAAAGNSLLIGKRNIYNALSAYMDDVRITRGTSRGYTGSTITVPTDAFPNQ